VKCKKRIDKYTVHPIFLIHMSRLVGSYLLPKKQLADIGFYYPIFINKVEDNFYTSKMQINQIMTPRQGKIVSQYRTIVSVP